MRVHEELQFGDCVAHCRVGTVADPDGVTGDDFAALADAVIFVHDGVQVEHDPFDLQCNSDSKQTSRTVSNHVLATRASIAI